MKVLYIASSPQDQGPLLLEREITALQRHAASSVGEPVEFRFLPQLPVEALHQEVCNFQPTIVHISAHGERDSLAFSSEENVPGTDQKEEIPVSAAQLSVMLRCSPPPKLVYLNACNSTRIAEAIGKKLCCLAIGTTEEITNRAAMASAVQFYRRLLAGATAREAFEASHALLTALDKGKTESKLHSKDSAVPENLVFVDVPKIIARFPQKTSGKKGKSIKTEPKQGDYEVEIGVCGCPSGTTQIVLFTDDATFISKSSAQNRDEADALALDMALISRDQPMRGIIWVDGSIHIDGDCRFFAAGVVCPGNLFTAQSSICDALQLYSDNEWYDEPSSKESEEIVQAIKQLRQRDGGPPIEPGSDGRHRKGHRNRKK